MSVSESLEQINAQTMATANKTTKSNFRTAKNSSIAVVNIVLGFSHQMDFILNRVFDKWRETFKRQSKMCSY